MIRERNIAMVAYTEYVRDPRVRRYGEALVRNGYNVDCFVLKEQGKPKFQIINGVALHHLNLYQYRGKSNISYIYSYLKFFFLTKIALVKNLSKSYSVIHIHNMPDFLVFAGFINKLFGSKIILDIHDTMPELYLVKFNSVIRNVVYHILLFQEKCSSYFADIVITVHVPHLEHIVQYHKIKRNKFIVIPNFADKNLFYSTLPNELSQERKEVFKMIYHGTIAKRFGLDIVLNGIKELKSSDCKPVQFNIYGKGDGVSDLKRWISELELSKEVIYHGQISLDEIPEKISQADLGIVSYIHSEATNLMLPLKLLEYTAMGIPSLTVKNSPISFYFKPDELAYYKSNDSFSFLNKLIKLIKSPSLLHRLREKTEKVNQRLNWESEEVKYISLIKKLSNNYIT